MKKYSFGVEEQITYRHKIEIETELEENEVLRLLDEFDLNARHMCMGINDMKYFFEERGIKVTEICKDVDGDIKDVESYDFEEIV